MLSASGLRATATLPPQPIFQSSTRRGPAVSFRARILPLLQALSILQTAIAFGACVSCAVWPVKSTALLWAKEVKTSYGRRPPERCAALCARESSAQRFLLVGLAKTAVLQACWCC